MSIEKKHDAFFYRYLLFFLFLFGLQRVLKLFSLKKNQVGIEAISYEREDPKVISELETIWEEMNL